MKLIVTSPAQIEAKKAFDWYEKLEEGLGERFLDSVQVSFEFIKQNPYSSPFIYSGLRSKIVQVFPFKVIYRFNEKSSEILVIAISHQYRKPDYWLNRI